MKTQKYAVNPYLIESVLSKVRQGEIFHPGKVLPQVDFTLLRG